MDTERLSEIIADYEYSQSNILDNGAQFLANPRTRQVKMDSFYRHGEGHKQGSCVELMNTAYQEISDAHPELHITRAWGNDPNFFWSPEHSGHSFLLVSYRSLMNGTEHTADPEVMARVSEQDPLVVDPSFGVVAPLSESGYAVRQATNPGVGLKYWNNGVFDHGESVPVGFDSQGNLAYLIVNFGDPKLFGIGLQEPKSDVHYNSLNDESITERLSEDFNLIRFIGMVNGRRKRGVRRKLKPSDGVVIK